MMIAWLTDKFTENTTKYHEISGKLLKIEIYSVIIYSVFL